MGKFGKSTLFSYILHLFFHLRILYSTFQCDSLFYLLQNYIIKMNSQDKMDDCVRRDIWIRRWKKRDNEDKRVLIVHDSRSFTLRSLILDVSLISSLY